MNDASLLKGLQKLYTKICVSMVQHFQYINFFLHIMQSNQFLLTLLCIRIIYLYTLQYQ